MFRVMIIEDNLNIADILKKELEKWQYEAVYVTNFQQIIEKFNEYSPHIVLIDIKLPYFNGYYWCEQIRKHSQVPIMFISSKNESMDIVMAMQMGADDFISKPFDLSVVIAKIQALIRRTYDFKEKAPVLTCSNVLLKPSEALVEYENQKSELTRNELKILEMLFQNKGSYVSREDLMTNLWNHDSFVDDNTLAVNMTRLRKKLAEIGLNNFILTKKTVGYAVKEVEESAEQSAEQEKS